MSGAVGVGVEDEVDEGPGCVGKCDLLGRNLLWAEFSVHFVLVSVMMVAVGLGLGLWRRTSVRMRYAARCWIMDHHDAASEKRMLSNEQTTGTLGKDLHSVKSCELQMNDIVSLSSRPFMSKPIIPLRNRDWMLPQEN